MDIEVIKKLIQKYQVGHSDFIHRCSIARRYYRNDTDVLHGAPREEDKAGSTLRTADNRIPFNFHGLLVNQKASYMFTAPPLFDLGSDRSNKILTAFLGDKYAKACKDLCIEASNCSVGWLHLWRNEKGRYKYAVVPAEQIIPVWSSSLEKELIGVFRVYPDTDVDTGDNYMVYEYWNDRECAAYRMKIGDDLRNLEPYNMFLVDPALCTMSAEYRHDIGEVPFFPFFNNNIDSNDLINIKPLIDCYCKVFSGFFNDLEDVQEVILVLTNYGGQDLGEFIRDLKNYKAIKLENDGDGEQSGVSTLTIQLPVEAREKMLTITRHCIFEQGQGIDPDPQNFGNSSGVALAFLYSLLELKSGLQETEFRLAFGRFIRCVCRLLGIPIKDDSILQTWTRTSVRNDQELAQIAQQSKGIISDETIIEKHPWVDDPARELERMEEQEEETKEMQREISEMFPKTGENGAGSPENGQNGAPGGNPNGSGKSPANGE